MLKLSFHQTSAEIMVRAAATVIFNALTRTGQPLVPLSKLTEDPQYGFTASATSVPAGPKFVRITDLQDAGINWDAVPYCECKDPEKYLLEPYDLLFARTGATTGKTHLIIQCPRAVFASYLIRLRPTPTSLAEYLYSFFQSDSYWLQISDSKEGSAQPNVNGRKLMNILVPLVDSTTQSAIRGFLKAVRERQDGRDVSLPELPSPLQEQRRIVSRIEDLANKVESARNLRAESGRESGAILDRVIQVAFDELAHFPLSKLSTLSSKIGSGSTPLGGRANYPSSGIPFIRSLNVRMRRFQWEGMAFIPTTTHDSMSGTKVKPNDVLLNITGASIGRVACAPSELKEANVNQHVAIIRPLKVLDSRYLMYWLSQPRIQHLINEQEKGATRQGFTKAQIESFMIPLPPIEDQKRIVDRFDNLQIHVNTLKKLQSETAAELDALMPSILAKAFCGEL